MQGDKEVSFSRASFEELKAAELPSSLTMAIIDQKKNDLNSYMGYSLSVIYNDEDGSVSKEHIKIFPYGELPLDEKDDREKNAHLMAFDKSTGKWRKLEGELDEEGHFCLCVKIVHK